MNTTPGGGGIYNSYVLTTAHHKDFKADARGLDRDMVAKIFTLIHESSVQQQQQ